MNRVTKHLAPLLLACTALPVFASNWVFFGGNDVGQGRVAEVYIDTASIAPKGKYVKAWIKENFNAPVDSPELGAKYQSSVFLFYFDCSSQEMARAAVQNYAGRDTNGGLVFSGDVPFHRLHFTEVRPDSSGEAWLKFVCRARRQ